MSKATTATTLVRLENVDQETERVRYLDRCSEVHIRMSLADQEQVELIRSHFGLTMSAAIRAAIHQTANKIKSGG